MTLRVLIVDDEPLARRRIRTLMKGMADVEIAGECGDGRTAVAAIAEKKPDLVFLDVQMPELDGFGVVEALGDERMPIIIFVTAYDQYALEAFDAHALDYLLKPFPRARFEKALARARAEHARRQTGEFARRVLEMLGERRGASKPLERLVVKSGSRIYFLSVDEIDWLEAAGNYVKLHTGAEAHLVRGTMATMEGQLGPEKFLRIHRSAIVNVARVKELHPWSHGDYVVVLQNGKKLILSRSYRPRVEERLGQQF